MWILSRRQYLYLNSQFLCCINKVVVVSVPCILTTQNGCCIPILGASQLVSELRDMVSGGDRGIELGGERRVNPSLVCPT